MEFRSVSPKTLLRRVLLVVFGTQVVAVASLMAVAKVRRSIRARGLAPLPRVEPQEFAVGNSSRAEVYVSGEALFDDMLAAIDSATERILFESYIVKGDEMGQRFKAALIAAAGRGVAVYVIYDGFANMVVKRSFFRFPEPIRVLRFPVFPRTFAFFSPRAWGRDHRKILVVDDRIGFVGGYNVGSLYTNQWRDTHVSVTGSAVWDLENTFIDFWNDAHPDEQLRPLSQASWDPHVRAHRNVPRQLIYPIRGMYLEAIDRATSTIEITQAYFIPDRNILEALVDASRRGVQVRILIPRVSNHVVADFVARSYFGRLLDAGVEILRYGDHMVHAKTMTIDGEWSTIGTANIDRLSLTGNYEINLEILDSGLADGMSQIFARDATRAEPLSAEDWRERPTISRIYERVLRPWRPLV